MFVTVNDARAAAESSRVTLSLAAVTVKLGARFDTDKEVSLRRFQYDDLQMGHSLGSFQTCRR
jgi:hypothetical protein